MRPTLLLVTGIPGSGKTTLAARCAELLNAAVLGHDWAMAGLRPYPEVQHVLQSMDRVTARSVGWNILWSLARAQLRSGRSIVLDGVARDCEVERTRAVADEEGVAPFVVLLDCPDREAHRQRIEGRFRGIPDWYEVAWSDVAHALTTWSAEATATPDVRIRSDTALQGAYALIEAALQRSGLCV